MAETMMAELLQTPDHEDEPALGARVIELITQTTGQTASYQMACLAEEVGKRGGQVQDPLVYKECYVQRLGERINSRGSAQVQARAARRHDGAGRAGDPRTMRERSVRCYLVSGTYEPYVLDEAAALNLTQYFDSIHGAQDDPTRFSKKQFMERLVAQNHLQESEFASLGDGSVEIAEAKPLGGIAIGVASSEARRTGLDMGKRDLLIRAGADIIVPDFREHRHYWPSCSGVGSPWKSFAIT
jgi:hypothetical protein